MERSLTVLLPVHNAQSTLVATVAEVLEVVSDLTERFELVIVDDGSADSTSEVAHELTRRYPQVRAVCHGEHLGRETAIRTGLRHSRGEIILLRNEGCGLAPDGIAKLWRAACEHQVGAEHPATPTGPAGSRFDAGRSGRGAGYQIIDRRSIEQIHTSSQPARPNYLAKLRDFALGE